MLQQEQLLRNKPTTTLLYSFFVAIVVINVVRSVLRSADLYFFGLHYSDRLDEKTVNQYGMLGFVIFNGLQDFCILSTIIVI